ncbi:MAG: hypothetical protein Q9225_006165 [Loekoesia sp. 1 TL-2023]
MIVSIAQELATTECAWKFVQNMLEQRKCQNDMNREILLQLNQTMLYGRQVLSFLNDELSMTAKEHGFRQRTRIVWNERRLRNHENRIRGQIMSMSLLISLLRLPASWQQSKPVHDENPVTRPSRIRASTSLPSQPLASVRELDGRNIIDGQNCHELGVDGTTYPELGVDSDAYFEMGCNDNAHHEPSMSGALPIISTHKRNSRYQGVKQTSSNTYLECQPDPILQEMELQKEAHAATHPPKHPEDIDNEQKDTDVKAIENSNSIFACTTSAPPYATNLGESTQLSQEKAKTDGHSLCIADSPRTYAALHENCADDGNSTYQPLTEILEAASDHHRLESALHYACQHGNVRLVNELLMKGVSVHSRVRQTNPDIIGPAAIHLTAMHGQSEVALTLLQYGARPNDHYHDQRRPLHDAAENGDDTMTALLLEHGARPYLCDNKGIQPLHLVSRNGSLKVARVLVDAGASIEAADHRNYRPLHHLAQSCDDPNIVLFLINLGCDLEARTSQGYTALQLASKAGNIRVLEVLLYQGASPEAGEWMAKPLALAITGGHLKTARLLLESGVEVNYRSPNTFETVAHIAARDVCTIVDRRQYTDSNVFTLLRQYGADINAQDVRGNTPLHIAVGTPSSSHRVQHQRFMVECLLRNGARADLPNHNGYYPLTLASRNLDLYVFRLVLAASVHKLPDKHLACIDREIRKKKAPTNHSNSHEMSSLLSTALVARALQV